MQTLKGIGIPASLTGQRAQLEMESIMLGVTGFVAISRHNSILVQLD